MASECLQLTYIAVQGPLLRGLAVQALPGVSPFVMMCKRGGELIQQRLLWQCIVLCMPELLYYV